MPQRKHDEQRIDGLDRQWDRFLDDPRSRDGLPDETDYQITEVHRRDDVPGPSDIFRQQLENTLREMHPAGAAEPATDTDHIEREMLPVPLHRASYPRNEQAGSSIRPSTLRQWGELAAIVAILSLAIVGAARYGDSTWDYAQRTLFSSDEDTVDVSDLRATLAEQGEVDGLTYEEAQALAPFEMAEPSSLSGGMSIEDRSVEQTHLNQSGRVSWTLWRSTTEIAIDGSDLPPIQLIQQPAGEIQAIPMPRDGGEAGPTGRLQIVDIGGIGAVQVLERTEGTETTRFVWRQGNVDILVEVPFDATGDKYSIDELDEMLASILDQGSLNDGADEIAHRGMTLEQFRATMPTFPVADPTPRPLELIRVDNWIYGPNFSYELPGSPEHGGIWIRSIGVTGREPVHNRRADITQETLRVGETSVAHTILTDRFAPETAKFIEAADLRADLLLPWISGHADTALAIYIWSVAGQDYLMGVEIPHNQVISDTQDEPIIEPELPETDWLAIIAEQAEFAAEHLDPAELFPAIAREPSEQDQISGHDLENSRLIGTTEQGRYYIALDHAGQTLMLYQFVDVEGEDQPRSSGGGAALWHAAEYGVTVQMGGGGSGYHVAWLLPQGYDEVVDGDGNVIGAVENQLFAISFGEDVPRPRNLIARGPVGELSLDATNSTAETR